jgi:hypothetical protein
MNLDLSKKITSVGYRFNPETQQRVPVQAEVEIRKIIMDSTERTSSFKEALKVKSLREKAKGEADVVELTQEELSVLITVYRVRPTDEKLALIEILAKLNPGMDMEILM